MLLSRDCARRGSSYSTIPYGGPSRRLMRYSLTDMRELCCWGPSARALLLLVMSLVAITPSMAFIPTDGHAPVAPRAGAGLLQVGSFVGDDLFVAEHGEPEDGYDILHDEVCSSDGSGVRELIGSRQDLCRTNGRSGRAGHERPPGGLRVNSITNGSARIRCGLLGRIVNNGSLLDVLLDSPLDHDGGLGGAVNGNSSSLDGALLGSSFDYGGLIDTSLIRDGSMLGGSDCSVLNSTINSNSSLSSDSLGTSSFDCGCRSNDGAFDGFPRDGRVLGGRLSSNGILLGGSLSGLLDYGTTISNNGALDGQLSDGSMLSGTINRNISLLGDMLGSSLDYSNMIDYGALDSLISDGSGFRGAVNSNKGLLGGSLGSSSPDYGGTGSTTARSTGRSMTAVCSAALSAVKAAHSVARSEARSTTASALTTAHSTARSAMAACSVA